MTFFKSTTISSIAVTAAISVISNNFINSVYHDVLKWDWIVKQKIRFLVFNNKEPTLVNNKKSKTKKFNYIEGIKAAKEIKASLERGLNIGGLYVLAAPPDSGKSAHLQEILPHVKIVYFDATEALTERNLRVKLGVPEGRAFSDFLPIGSWIIIDQFDRATLNKSDRDFFTSLATSSVNSQGGFSFMVCVSQPGIFKSILGCNSKRKIYPVCNPLDFQVSEDFLSQYIRKVMPEADVESILKQYGKFRSIGIVRSAVLDGQTCHVKPDWESFSIVYNNFYNPTFILSIRI